MGTTFARWACYAIGCSLVAMFVTPVERVQAERKPLLVVVSNTIPLQDISMADLRRVFLGLPTVVRGTKLLPWNQAIGSPERVKFDSLVIGLSPSQVGAFWIDRRIRDQSSPPRSVPSVSLSARVVASLPGAISYMFADGLSSNLRALKVDGKEPRESDYALR